jgi:hypothetical protein
MSTAQINPFRPSPSHCATESQYFRFSVKNFNLSALVGGPEKIFFYRFPNPLSAALHVSDNKKINPSETYKPNFFSIVNIINIFSFCNYFSYCLCYFKFVSISLLIKIHIRVVQYIIYLHPSKSQEIISHFPLTCIIIIITMAQQPYMGSGLLLPPLSEVTKSCAFMAVGDWSTGRA